MSSARSTSEKLSFGRSNRSTVTMNRDTTELTLYLRQCTAALGALIAVVAAGCTTGYSAVLLPQLRPSALLINNDSFAGGSIWDDFNVTTLEQESWIASATVLPMAPGCFLAGAMMDRVGRRMTGLLMCPVFLLGWLTVGVATNVFTMIVGRLLCGLSVGILGPLGPVYISETSHPKLRGILLAATCVSLSTGIMLSHILGSWLHWRIVAYVCAAIPVLCWISTFVARESPTWLLATGKAREARECWIYLRGEQSLDEFTMAETTSILAPDNGNLSRRSLLMELSSRKFLRPLAVVCVFFLTLQFSGVNAVTFYAVEMLADVSGPGRAYVGCLTIDAIRLIFSALACLLVKKCPRRALAIISGAGTALTLLTLSACLLLDVGRPWLPAILLFVYSAFVVSGLIPLPWMLCAELFSRNCRGFGSGITSGFSFICFFVVVKTGPAMFDTMQPYGAFAFYGVVVLIGTAVLYVTLPETKDRSLEEIEASINRRSGNKYFCTCVPTNALGRN